MDILNLIIFIFSISSICLFSIFIILRLNLLLEMKIINMCFKKIII